MRLLNDLLVMYDGFNLEEWLRKCKKIMIDTFPREDPFSILVPPGFESFDIDKVSCSYRLNGLDFIHVMSGCSYKNFPPHTIIAEAVAHHIYMVEGDSILQMKVSIPLIILTKSIFK